MNVAWVVMKESVHNVKLLCSKAVLVEVRAERSNALRQNYSKNNLNVIRFVKREEVVDYITVMLNAVSLGHLHSLRIISVKIHVKKCWTAESITVENHVMLVYVRNALLSTLNLTFVLVEVLLSSLLLYVEPLHPNVEIFVKNSYNVDISADNFVIMVNAGAIKRY